VPWFLYIQTFLWMALTIGWVATEPRAGDPYTAAYLSGVLGIQGVAAWIAVSKRSREPWGWWRGRTWIGTLAVATGMAGVLALSTVGSASHAQWWPGSPRTLIGWLSWFFTWFAAGWGFSAWAFGLTTVELERPGARRLGLVLGAWGLGTVWSFEGLGMWLAATDRWPLAVSMSAFWLEHCLVAAAAGYLFLASRALAPSALLLGAYMAWTRHVAALPWSPWAAGWRVTPLEEGPFWAIRLVTAAACLAGAIALAQRVSARDQHAPHKPRVS